MTALSSAGELRRQRCKRRAITVERKIESRRKNIKTATRYTAQMGRVDLRMQQAAAKFSHEILWW